MNALRERVFAMILLITEVLESIFSLKFCKTYTCADYVKCVAALFRQRLQWSNRLHKSEKYKLN